MGGIIFRKDSPAEDWWQLVLAREHASILREVVCAHGVMPIIDDVIASRSVLDDYRSNLPQPVRLIYSIRRMTVSSTGTLNSRSTSQSSGCTCENRLTRCSRAMA